MNAAEDGHDAQILRCAARILQKRAKRQTFALRVIVKALRNTAGRLEQQRGG